MPEIQFSEIEERHAAISKRMDEISAEIKRGFVGREAEASSLADELGRLLHEAKVLQVSLQFARQAAEELMSCRCHGPH